MDDYKEDGGFQDPPIRSVILEMTPVLIIGAVAITVLGIMYGKDLASKQKAYINYLDSKNALFAEALDSTTEAIINSLKT